MNCRSTLTLRLRPFAPILLGYAAFLFVTGGKILRPTYTDWLMEGDPAAHWLGWQFFRHSPLFQWPIGANFNYGMDIGSSIVFTDSIPLLAFIFKPLNVFLPHTFQYFGPWILICFLLQSYLAWKLLTLFTQDEWLPLIGSVFFTLAPVCLWRLQGHYALFGQWVLLAGLFFYFTKKFSIFPWIGLLATAALINAYLLVMVVIIYSADLIQRCWLKQTAIVKTFSYFFVASVCVAIIMWAAGYFMVGAGVGIGGFGIYRMNLLSLFDPDDIWSKLLSDQKGGGGDYEGFNYMGLGMLGLGLVAGYKLFRDVKIGAKGTMIPLLVISLGFFLYAISNHVAIGPHQIYSYNLPSVTEPLTNAFRCSGRFFWPVYYVIYLGIFYLIFTRSRRSTAITFCAVMLFFQLIDSTGVWRTFKRKFAQSPAWSSPMRSPIWSDIARRYSKIIFVLPRNISTDWMPLAEFAATHRMAINTGHFARINPEKEHEVRVRIATSIRNNELTPDSLYVFENDCLWEFASSQVSPSDIAGVLDGFRIVAPNLRECKECNTAAIKSISVVNRHDFGDTMERISFTSNGTGGQFSLYGWSDPEPWGTWSDGDAAALVLNVSNLPENDLELLIEGNAFLARQHRFQEVDIVVNKQYVATLKYDQQSNGGVRTVKIPKRLALEDNGRLLLKFKFKNPKSPADLGLSGDNRRLGLGIVSMELKPADYAPAGSSAPRTFPHVIRVTADTPHQVGGFDSKKQALVTKQSEAGAVVFGPYVPLEPGKYRAVFKLSAGGSSGEAVGRVDVNAFSDARPNNPVAAIDLKPATSEQRITLDFQSARCMKYEFRVWANGKGTLSAKEVVIERRG